MARTRAKTVKSGETPQTTAPEAAPRPGPASAIREHSLIMLDPNLRIRQVNRSTLDLLGYAESDLVGKPMAAIMGRPREAVAALTSLSELLFSETTQSIGLTYYARNQKPIPVSFSSCLLQGPEGNSGIACMARPRSKTIQETQEDVSDPLRRLTLINHELRTPLNAILGMAQLLLDSDLDLEQKDCARTIRDSGKDLLRVIRDLLDYGQMESGRTALQQTGFDLRDCLEEALEHIRPIVRGKLLNLSFHLDPAAPRSLRGDPVRLRQILMHLLTNAARFTDQGEIEVRVAVETATPSGPVRLRFSVRDTGMGIAPDKRHAIFEPFLQEDAVLTRNHPGLGLGLSIARRLVELMGGSLWVESRQGAGSTFTFDAVFETGVHSLTDVALTTGMARLDAAERRPGTRRLRILVAEGNRVEQKIARRLLGTWGHDVTLVDDGLRALEAWERDDFDVVLLDLEMPKLDGLNAALTIRKREGRNRHVPIIAMTGNDRHREEQRSLLAGMDGCVSKPLDAEKLLKAIEATVHESPMLDE